MTLTTQSRTSPREMTVQRLGGTLGAEIGSVDLTRVGADDVEWLRALLRDHKVLVFRNQTDVGPHELANFGRCFGSLEEFPHPTHPSFEGEPGVKILKSDTTDVNNSVQDTWHTDGSVREKTRYISILQAVDVPDYGRDTCFADMEAVYEHLSAPIRNMLDGLTAEHSWGIQKPGAPPFKHPVVLTDGATGRKALYVNQQYTTRIRGLRRDESKGLLEILFNQLHFVEFQVRVSWRPGTIVVWDNERTQHYLVYDRSYPRVMHRVMAS